MKKNILETMRTEATAFFTCDNYKYDDSSKNMLVVMQDLDLNGANVVLKELLEAYNKDRKWQLWVISPTQGLFLNQMLGIGANVAIRENVYCDPEYREFMQDSFDLVFMNSSSVHYYAMYFINCKVPVLWWFHESEEQLSRAGASMIHLGLLSDNFTICSVMPLVQRAIRKLYGIDSIVFPMLVKESEILGTKKDDKVRFFCPSGYSWIKGQDIMLEAITRLPKEFADKSEFIFAGYQFRGQSEYFERLKSLAERLPNVKILEAIDRSEVYKIYAECDCVAAPSRIEPTPTTIVEGLMFRKLCLVSDKTGISEFMTDCVNGFIFENENVDELFKRLLLIISEVDNLSPIGQNGRKIYDEIFAEDKGVERLAAVIEEIAK